MPFFHAGPPLGPFFKSTLPFLHANPPLGLLFLVYVAVFSRQPLFFPLLGPLFLSPRCRFFMPAHHWAPFFKSTLPFLHANPPLGPLVLVYVADFSGQPITEPPFFSLRCRFSCQPTTWPPFFWSRLPFFQGNRGPLFSLRCANPPISPLFLSLRCRFFTPTHRWFSLFCLRCRFFRPTHH